jgi:hypothetical protein
MPSEAVLIRGRILARLLGLKLLTLDANIITAPQPWPGPQSPPPPEPPPPRAARAVPGSGLARARQLVSQSARVLNEGPGRP